MFASIIPESNLSYKLGDDFRKKIEAILNPSWKFSEPITNYFNNLNQVIERLTEEQFLIIDYLKRQRRVSISGCAGSGKTLVAMEKAIRLKQEGFTVLFLCHNPYLADNIRSKIERVGIKVFSFKMYIDYLISKSLDQKTINKYPEFESNDPWTQFEEPSEKELKQVLGRLNTESPNYDAVIIDEGQDFKANWWPIVESSLADPENGILYIFFDERQVVLPINHLEFPVTIAPYDLSRNCRNTGEIYKLVRQLGYAMPEINQELIGKGVVREWIFSSESDLINKVKEALINAEEFSPNLTDIVVLTAELKSIKSSIFSGIVFGSPNLQKSGWITRLSWQDAVLKFVNPKGFPEGQLSKKPSPTEGDIKAVKDFCYHWLNRRKNFPDTHIKERIIRSYHWSMNLLGKLILINGDYPVGENDEWETMVFFNDRGWSRTLPPLSRLYRLTPLYEVANYPSFTNVRLVNVPMFKGLESDGIVFIYYDYSGVYDTYILASLYIALSRAKHLLNIVTPIPIQDEILRLNKFINN
jgi:hypothetical protein